MKRMLFVALLAVTIAPALAQQRAPHNDSIRQDDLRADLFFLAGDAMKGRLTDTDENRATADYIRSRFERAGLKPAAGNSFFQNYDLMTSTIAAEGNAIEIGQPDRSSRHLRLGTDFYPHRFSASGRASAGVTFVGFGISAPHLQYDDYANRTSIAGRIALILDHEPGERDPNSPFDGVVTTEPAAAWRKVLAAQEHGAIGTLCQRRPQPYTARRTSQAARNYAARRRASRTTPSQPGPDRIGFRRADFAGDAAVGSPTAARRLRSCRSSPKRRTVMLTTQVDQNRCRSTSSPIATSSPCSKAAIRD
jgi:hypothetical protein